MNVTSVRQHEWAPCDLYHAYVSARDEAREALGAWRAAPVRDRGEGFAAYRAAAEREDAAAFAWMRACAADDAAHAQAALLDLDLSHELGAADALSF